MIGRPEILVADEPTGNVDPDMAERLLHLFDSLNRLGTTVVVATHDFHLLNRIPERADDAARKGAAASIPPASLRNPPAQRDDGASASIPTRPTAACSTRAGGTRAMTWIMAIMLFLTVLAGALGLGMLRRDARSSTASSPGG